MLSPTDLNAIGSPSRGPIFRRRSHCACSTCARPTWGLRTSLSLRGRCFQAATSTRLALRGSARNTCPQSYAGNRKLAAAAPSQRERRLHHGFVVGDYEQDPECKLRERLFAGSSVFSQRFGGRETQLRSRLSSPASRQHILDAADVLGSHCAVEARARRDLLAAIHQHPHPSCGPQCTRVRSKLSGVCLDQEHTRAPFLKLKLLSRPKPKPRELLAGDTSAITKIAVRRTGSVGKTPAGPCASLHLFQCLSVSSTERSAFFLLPRR
ncbi:hypothetical protein AURDEDRAFT_176505 [Auricularia subglabra TFB-10046 SS5]|nr:hypothetical protein AURDEDRAFT_176505 [Auricularia subglabra TFB-10046 SS5]